jgi:hypothetical protein
MQEAIIPYVGKTRDILLKEETLYKKFGISKK